MTQVSLPLIPAPAPWGFQKTGAPGAPGILVEWRDALIVASVIARRHGSPALAATLREHLGLDLPQGPRHTSARDTSLIGIGAESWLCLREGNDLTFVSALSERLKNCAAVSDQTDGYPVLRLMGPKVRDVLAKLVAIDVHSRAFRVGDAAATGAARMSLTLWRLEDAPNASPVFELTCPRSMAVSFAHALTAAATEYGLDVAR